MKGVEGFTEAMAKEIADSFDWVPGQFVTFDKDAIFELLKDAMK